MIDRGTLKIAALRGLLLAVALAIAWPLIAWLSLGIKTDVGVNALSGFAWGLVAAPCAVLEAVGRRRGGAWVPLAALAAWALAVALDLAIPPALEYAKAGGGEAGLEAASRSLSLQALSILLPWALGAAALYGALTLARAAGAGLLAQATFTFAVTTLGSALGAWSSEVNQLFHTFDALLREALQVAGPQGLLAVAAAALVDRLLWRAAPVPARALEGALPWSLVAVALVLFPFLLHHRSEEGVRTARIVLAKRLVEEGGRNKGVALVALLQESPGDGRAVVVELAARGDVLALRHAEALCGHAADARPLLARAEPKVRALAVDLLVKSRDPGAVDVLALALDDDDPTIRDAGLDALLRPASGQRASDVPAFQRAVAGSRAVHERARRLLRARDAEAREQAVRLLEASWWAPGLDDAAHAETWRALEAALAAETVEMVRARLEWLLRGAVDR